MSDENLTSVEDAPEIEAEAPAQETPPPAPEVEAPPATEGEPDGEPEDKEKAGLIAAVKTLRAELQQLKPIAQEYQQVRPYVDFLRAHPDLIAGTTRTPIATPGADQPTDDPLAEALAKKLDLYTAEGKPDAARGAELVKVVRQLASDVAEEQIRPYAETTAQEKSQINFQRALSVTDQSGTYKPSPETLSVMWRGMPPHMTADERVATVMAWAAIGHDVLAGKYQRQPEPPAREPVITEPPGGRNVNRPSISEFEQRVAKLRGLKSEDWTKRTEGWKPGAGGVLED